MLKFCVLPKGNSAELFLATWLYQTIINEPWTIFCIHNIRYRTKLPQLPKTSPNTENKNNTIPIGLPLT